MGLVVYLGRYHIYTNILFFSNPQDVKDMVINYKCHLLNAQPNLKQLLLKNPPELNLCKVYQWIVGHIPIRPSMLGMGEVKEVRDLVINWDFWGNVL